MEQSINELSINGKIYVPKDSIQNKVTDTSGLPYVMCRTHTAGVFAGYLKERNGKEGILLNARRIWYWDGAASLSQLATEGTTNPSNCKFPCEVSEVTLTEIIEIIPITEVAKKSLDKVPIWKQ
jgi:hypothetical protein